MCVICVLSSVKIVLSICHLCPIYPLVYVVSFFYLPLYLTNYKVLESFFKKNSEINNAYHAFYGTQSFKNLIQVIP